MTSPRPSAHQGGATNGLPAANAIRRLTAILVPSEASTERVVSRCERVGVGCAGSPIPGRLRGVLEVLGIAGSGREEPLFGAWRPHSRRWLLFVSEHARQLGALVPLAVARDSDRPALEIRLSIGLVVGRVPRRLRSAAAAVATAILRRSTIAVDLRPLCPRE
jgi:hypothetical protein